MATIKDDSMLLDLPVELLKRITDYLPSETLTTARLTCKTLEAATLDRFVDLYCTARYCFVLSSARWTALQAQFKQSPRLTSKVNKLVFTTDFYECAGHTALQLAPEKRHKNMTNAQQKTYDNANTSDELLPWLQGTAGTDLATMIDVISTVQHASLHVTADLQMEPQMENLKACRHLVSAIVSTKLSLRHLTASYPFIIGVTESFSDDKEELLGCETSLTSFHFGSHQPASTRLWEFEQDPLDYVRKIIGSSKIITHLAFCLREYAYDVFDRPELVTAKLISGHGLPKLSHFRLHFAVVSEDVLKDFLTSCKSTLTHIDVCQVKLADPNSDWLDIFRKISGLPVLQSLGLCVLGSGTLSRTSWIDFEQLEHGLKIKGKRGYRTVEYDGRDDVVAGVGELLSKPLACI